MPERKVEKDFFSAKYSMKKLGTIAPQEQKEYLSTYSNKVLIGNWMQRAFSYTRNILPMASDYEKEYTKPDMKVTYNDFYDYKIRGWGTDWHTVNDQGLPEQYNNNFSTLYDLMYNRSCPKLIKRAPKKYSSRFNCMRPQPDMTANFGNTNDFGLQEYMKNKWKLDKKFDIHEITTTSEDAYVKHETPRYCGRKSPYKAISSSFCKITTMNQDFKTRNKKLCVCADYPPQFPCPRRNPNMILPTL